MKKYTLIILACLTLAYCKKKDTAAPATPTPTPAPVVNDTTYDFFLTTHTTIIKNPNCGSLSQYFRTTISVSNVDSNYLIMPSGGGIGNIMQTRLRKNDFVVTSQFAAGDCSSNSYPPTFNRVIKLYKNIYINGVWKDSISKFYYKDTTFTVR